MARVVVDVMLKPEILDPQGQAVANALPRLGVEGVSSVRVGRRIELEFDAAPDPGTVDELADRLLANPVIEDYTVTIGEEQTNGTGSPRPGRHTAAAAASVTAAAPAAAAAPVTPAAPAEPAEALEAPEAGAAAAAAGATAPAAAAGATEPATPAAAMASAGATEPAGAPATTEAMEPANDGADVDVVAGGGEESA